MPEFPVNPTRFDPYKAFKFRVSWDGRPVAGIDHVSGLIRTTDVVAHREGGDPGQDRVSPGRTRYEEDSAVAIESLTLENEGWERDTSVVEPVEPS